MAFTKKQRAAVKAIVSVHETGKAIANYSALVVLSDDAGITYGAHQATHKSGTLYKIVKMYCDISDSDVSKALTPYLVSLSNPAKRHILDKDNKLKALLKEAGKESEMHFAQDKVFEANYFEPAVRSVEGSGWVFPMSLAVVYDSMIQGGWTTCRDRTKASTEKDWIKQYVANRRKWLSSSSKQVVRNSVYRMATFEKLIAAGNWNLDVPFVAHGVMITNDALAVWMASENPARTVTAGEGGFVEPPEEPGENFFAGNSEGVAEDVDSHIGEPADDSPVPTGGSSSPDDTTANVPAVTPDETPSGTSTQGEPIDNSAPDDGVAGDPPKAGEPVPDKSAKDGEAVVGGRPQDPPIIIPPVTQQTAAGWKTWPTTVTATLGSLGISLASAGSWFAGAIKDPTSAKFVIVITIMGVVIAAGYGLFYLITRAITKNKEAQRAHEIALAELQLRSDPSRYNVKLERRTEPREAPITQV